MESFYQYESVAFPLRLIEPGTALYDQAEVICTLKQGRRRLTKKNPPLNERTGVVTLKLSQKETGMFKPGFVQLQVNVFYKNEERDVTDKALIKVLENLHGKEMP